MVKLCESEAEFDETIKSNNLVVVDFFAVWCPPCQYIAPILDQMSEEHKGTVSFLKVSLYFSDTLLQTFSCSKFYF